MTIRYLFGSIEKRVKAGLTSALTYLQQSEVAQVISG